MPTIPALRINPKAVDSGAVMQRAVIVKPCLEGGFETFIRATVGKAGDDDRFLVALEQAVSAVPATHRR